MATSVTLPYLPVTPGAYAHEILTPGRANGARLTMTRAPAGWPSGALFTLRILERQRNGVLQPLARWAETGGPALGKDGVTVNPPLVTSIQWGADKDRDLVRVELDVVQTFSTAITVEFL